MQKCSGLLLAHWEWVRVPVELLWPYFKARYLEIIEHLKKVITAAGKKYYTFVVGKLNVAKLANFQEIDVFVLVACPGAKWLAQFFTL
jgi:hypothetical protein